MRAEPPAPSRYVLSQGDDRIPPDSQYFFGKAFPSCPLSPLLPPPAAPSPRLPRGLRAHSLPPASLRLTVDMTIYGDPSRRGGGRPGPPCFQTCTPGRGRRGFAGAEPGRRRCPLPSAPPPLRAGTPPLESPAPPPKSQEPGGAGQVAGVRRPLSRWTPARSASVSLHSPPGVPSSLRARHPGPSAQGIRPALPNSLSRTRCLPGRSLSGN